MLVAAPFAVVATLLLLLVLSEALLTPLLRLLGAAEDNNRWETWLADIAPVQEAAVNRLPAKRADEQDVVTGWRHRLNWRPGEVAAINRRLRRRERHVGKHRLGQGADS